MRKCKVKIDDVTVECFFHGLFQTLFDGRDGIVGGPVAIVETGCGTLKEVEAHNLQFLGPPQPTTDTPSTEENSDE